MTSKPGPVVNRNPLVALGEGNEVVLQGEGLIARQEGVESVNFVFFFQAEDGIRDYKVTGVQTCALPIRAEDGIRDYKVTGVQTCALPIFCLDRKSTRLTSSHLEIQYAVFC